MTASELPQASHLEPHYANPIIVNIVEKLWILQPPMVSVARAVSQGRHSHHTAINDIVHRSLVSIKVPSHLESSGLIRSDGKRPNDMSIVPWSSGKLLVWDTNCTDTFSPFNIRLAVHRMGAVTEKAEDVKMSKYLSLDSSYLFMPVAVERCGAFGPKMKNFIKDLSHYLKINTEDRNFFQYLYPRISITVQRGNASSMLGTINSRLDYWITDLLYVITSTCILFHSFTFYLPLNFLIYI